MPKNTKTIAVYKENISDLEAQLQERLSAAPLEDLPESFQKELREISRLRPKSKSLKIEYVRYERELEYALQWDISTPEGRRQMEESERKAFATFKKRYGEIDYDDWRDMVENFGSAGQAVMEQFYRGGQGGNGDVMRVFKDAKEQGVKVNVGKAMQRVIRKSRREDFAYPKTPTGLLDALRDEIGLKS